MANSLSTLYSWSLNLNNMISISLVKDLEAKYNKYFVFFNVAPGVKKEDGTRGYDFKNGINFKLQFVKLSEISNVINAYVRGQGKMLGNYGIINDSSKSSYSSGNGGMKSLYFNYAPADEEKNKGIPGITIVAKYDKSISLYVPAPTALAFAEICKVIFDKAIQLDMSDFSSSPTYEGRGDDFEEEPKQTKKASGKKSSSSASGGSEDFPSFSNDAPF